MKKYGYNQTYFWREGLQDNVRKKYKEKDEIEPW